MQKSAWCFQGAFQMGKGQSRLSKKEVRRLQEDTYCKAYFAVASLFIASSDFLPFTLDLNVFVL